MTDNIDKDNISQQTDTAETAALRKDKQPKAPGEVKGALKAVPVILIAIALFLTLCFITGETGKFGRVISSVLKGLFSYMAYSIPVLIALHALFFFSDVRRHKVIFRIIFSIVTLITLSMVAYIIPNLTSELVFNAALFFENGKNNIGGGFVGSAIAYGITALIGKIGLIIVILLVVALYAIYFFTDGGSAMSRFFLERLAGILNFGARLEAKAEEKKRRDEEARIAAEKEAAERASAPFLEDEFFATDNGIETLEIPEIGIKETKTGFVGVGGLRSTIGGTEETEIANESAAQSTAYTAAEEPRADKAERYRASDIVYDLNENDTASAQDTAERPTASGNANGARTQSTTGSASTATDTTTSSTAANNATAGIGSIGIDDSADAVFTKDFDPYDIALNERRASKASSRAEATRETDGGFSEYIADLTPEQVARMKRIEAFEAAREAALRRREANEKARAAAAAAEEKARAEAAAAEAEVMAASESNECTEPAAEEPAADVTTQTTVTEPDTITASAPEERRTESVSHIEPESSVYKKPRANSYRYVASTVEDEPRLAYSGNEPTKAAGVYTAASTAPTYTTIAENVPLNADSDSLSVSAHVATESTSGHSTIPAVSDASFTFGAEKEACAFESEAELSSETAFTFETEAVHEDTTETGFTFESVPSEKIENNVTSLTFGTESTEANSEDNDGFVFDAEDSVTPASTIEVTRTRLEPDLDYDEDEDMTEGFEDGSEEPTARQIIPEDERNPDIESYRGYFTVLDDKNNITDTSRDAAEQADNEEGVTDDTEEAAVAADSDDNDTDAAFDSHDAEDDYDDAEGDDEPPFEDAVSVAAPIAAEQPKKKKVQDYSKYIFPPLDLLNPGKEEDLSRINDEIQFGADQLINTLESFNIRATVRGIERGPRITRYSIVPAKGVRVNQIEKLSDDIALAMAAESIRIEAPIPGKSAVGVEVPNKVPSLVSLRDLLEADEFVNNESKTAVCIGKSVEGTLIFDDIASMPHLLIAGATGMGKSVCINALITSMLFKAKPDEVKFIMIDPKQVEFAPYNGIPHLLVPVVTDPKQAAGALLWAVDEMNKRYDIIKELSVKTIDSYNAKVREHPELGAPMPKIIIFIDELNDLMLQVRDPVENLIMSIAQKARAAGIHLVIGTQRPSVNVITGVIKANIPSRIACKVSSGIDSRTILEQTGAEKLIGKGDMLVAPGGKPNPKRVQGAYVSETETERIVDFIKAQVDGDIYDEQALEDMKRAAQKCDKAKDDEDDGDTEESSTGFLHDRKFLNAVELAIRNKSVATSFLQRKLSIGYGRAAQYIDTMEGLGIVGEKNGSKPREVLISMDEWNEKLARLTEGY